MINEYDDRSKYAKYILLKNCLTFLLKSVLKRTLEAEKKSWLTYSKKVKISCSSIDTLQKRKK